MRGLFHHVGDVRSRAGTVRRHLAPTLRGPVLWLTFCGGLLVAAIFAGTIMMAAEFRERALVNSERELKNAVQLLARHFDEQFEDSDAIAADVITRLRVSDIDSPVQFKHRVSSVEAREILRSKGGALSYLGDISIFDSDGQIINWSRPSPLPALNISSRSYFQAFKSDPQAPAVLTEAIPSLISGNLNTVIAHRLNGANGVFLGVMTRRINPGNYEKFFASVALGASATIVMMHTEGTLLARYPRIEHMIGQKFPNAPLLQLVLNRGGAQTLRLQSPIDNADRLGSAAPLGHFPGVVIATNTVSAALADWRAQTRFLVVAAALSATVVALILFLIIRQ